MAKSVSNDALWEKLSEVSERLNKLSGELDSQVSGKEGTGDISKLSDIKDEIIAEIKQQSYLPGKHGDSNYEVINQNIASLCKIIRKTFNVTVRIRKQQKEAADAKNERVSSYFKFRFFKVRKTSLVIAVLGLLVFILTVFCMKLYR